MNDTSAMDLFDDMSEDESVNPTEDSDEEETEGEEVEEETSEEVFSDIPEGAVSVTAFAELLTRLDGMPYGYVVPQAVYQAVRAKRAPLPHVLVRTADDNAPRVYVMRDAALQDWATRAERLSTRGSGVGKAGSKRSAEELSEAFSKEDGAAWKVLYAESRRDMWEEILTERRKTSEKYERWMRDAGISVDEINDLRAKVKAEFEAAAQAKIEEREARAKATKEAKANGNGSNGS